MNFQDASNLRIPEGYVHTIHDKNSRLLWGSVGYNVSFDGNATQTGTPTPDSPQPISVVTGENVVKVVGKNLAPTANDATYTSNDVVYTAQNGVITIKGTSTRLPVAQAVSILDGFGSSANYPSYMIMSAQNSFSLPAGTYAISATVANNGNISDNNTGISVSVGTIGQRPTTMTPAVTPSTSSRTFTIEDGQRAMLIVKYEGNSTAKDIDTTISNVQIELGNQATTYEAYTAQDFEVNLGKNLFDKSTVTAGYRIGSDGLPFADSGFFLSDYIRVNASAVYAYSRAGSGSNSSAIAFYKSDKTFISRTMPIITNSATSGTVTSPAEAYYARICDTNANLDSAQLELGQATSYSEYFTPLELAKIGTYQDRIYKSGEKWYVEKQVGKITFDGSETWNAYSAGTVGGDYAYSTATKKFGFDGGNFVPKTNYICDHATQMTYVELVGTTVHSGLGSTQFASYFKVTSAIATTKEDFVTWLSTHPTTVYYALATPTTTEITDQTLIDQLEAVYDWVRRHGYNAQASGDLPIVINRSTLS